MTPSDDIIEQAGNASGPLVMPAENKDVVQPAPSDALTLLVEEMHSMITALETKYPEGQRIVHSELADAHISEAKVYSAIMFLATEIRALKLKTSGV